jgi:hypothetical protein
MSESPVPKPVLKLTSTVDIPSDSHGPLRIRKWMAKDSLGIRKLCHEASNPREFAERLLAQQSVEPPLSQEDLKAWDESEVTGVAVKWWQAVDALSSPPVSIDSLEGLLSAVRRRNDEHAQRMKALSRDIPSFKILEINIAERIAREVAQRKSLLDMVGQSSALKMLQQAELATRPLSVFAERLQAERLAFASIQERMRDVQLSASRAADLVKFAGPTHSLMAQATETDRAVRLMRDQLRSYESAVDSTRLKAVLGGLDTSAYKGFAPNLADLESVAARFKGPWISKMFPEASVMGVARMAALTAAAQAENPFAIQSVTAIREALGDWRNVKMPRRLLPDTNLREQFYLDHGFDRNLIQLPEPAFSQALANVGLVRPDVPSADVEDEDVDEEEILHQRMNRAYDLFHRLERKLREYIDSRLSEQYGPDWERGRCHGNGTIYDTWVKKREKDVQNGMKPERLIYYADFTDYAGLITKADNWEAVFKTAFLRPENVREAFHRLGPVRVCTMHARPITKTEFTLAAAEITRLLIAIGVSVDDDGED